DVGRTGDPEFGRDAWLAAYAVTGGSQGELELQAYEVAGAGEREMVPGAEVVELQLEVVAGEVVVEAAAELVAVGHGGEAEAADSAGAEGGLQAGPRDQESDLDHPALAVAGGGDGDRRTVGIGGMAGVAPAVTPHVGGLEAEAGRLEHHVGGEVVIVGGAAV